MERTLVIVKPDGVNRGLIGEVVKRFEEKGLKIAAMKMETLTQEKLEGHYAHHKDKPFFKGLVGYMSSAPSVFLVVEGKDAVGVVRKMCGATNGAEAEPGTIRGDYAVSVQCNVVHTSEDKEAAKAEIERFFKPEEIQEYKRADEDWVCATDEK